jgi:hypothetical protein
MEQTLEIKEPITLMVPVRLVGIDNRFHVAPIYVAPKFDELMGKFYVGDKEYKGKLISDQGADPKVFSAEGAPMQFTNLESFRIAHLQMFDPANESQMLILQMAVDSGYVAKDKGDINPTQHRYYIENKDSEAKLTISKASKVRMALELIGTLSAEKMEDTARLVGEYVKGMSKTQAQAALEKLAMEKPERLLAVFEDKDREVKIFLNKLVGNSVVIIEGGQYMFNKQVIGISEGFAIEWLKDKGNESVVRQMATLVKGK